MTYTCTDGYGAELAIQADSARKAAEQYVQGGCWGDEPKTSWVKVRVWSEVDEDGDPIDEDRIKIAIEPEEPECADSNDHIWSDRHDIVGGIESNPGVWGHGGGVRVTRVCVRCGCKHIEDTWAQDPEDGEQLNSTEYVEDAETPDEMVQTLLRSAGASEDELEYAFGCSAVDLFPADATDDPDDLLERVRAAMEHASA